MTPKDQMIAELQRHIGHAGPGTVVATAKTSDGTTIGAELLAVDSQGCLVREVQAHAPKLAGAGFDVLQEWADTLSRRISYLLETLGILEVDEDQGEVLIRSNPPERQGSTTSYYEVLLSHAGPGRFVLRRYESQRGIPGRTAKDMQLTHEVLGRLARDLAETVPPVP